MSARKKAFLVSFLFHILIFIIAFFVNFHQEKPTEFIEVEFAQALPPLPRDNEPQAQSVQIPKTIPKIPDKNEKKTIEQPNPPEDQNKKIVPQKQIVTLPKRNLVTDDEEDKIFVPKKKLPPPVNDFDDFLSMDKPEIKKADISEYKLDTPVGDEEDSMPPLPDISRLVAEDGKNVANNDNNKKLVLPDLAIEGDIKNRKVIERPVINPSSVDEPTEIKVKIIVSPEGLIEHTIPLQKGGYLERLVIENLRKWRFDKLPSDQPQENQSGVITFKFLLN